MKYICQVCSTEGSARPAVVKSGRKKYCSLACRNKAYSLRMVGNRNNDSWDPKGEKNPNWKGNAVSYRGLHLWILRQLGQPQECWECGTKEYHRYEWANVNKLYGRNISDWVRLCVSCHRRYDSGSMELTCI